MNTSLFEWAKDEGLSMKELAARVGVTWRHLYRIRNGEYPVTANFRARVIFHLGDWARALFFGQESENSDVVSEEAANG